MTTQENRYRGTAGQAYHEGKRQIPTPAYPWVARARARKLSRFIPLNAVVLEYGVGYGWNLAALPCQKRLGYDIAESVAQQAREHGIQFFHNEHDIPQHTAHILLCHHVLEHLLHPTATLQRFKQWLAPQGQLLLIVPWEREKNLQRYQPNEPNHHLYSWSPQSLGNLLADCNYTVHHATALTYGYDRFAAKWAHRTHTGETGFRLLRKTLQTLRPLRESLALATPV
ncbi:MAG: methyltransferase domain-containing protein [Limisphaerales bacterium]|jgi:2-polyprenyl-3-methyl-5-hydroxy-6-metoxy-1,4-benzoquinol methylase